MSERGRDRDRNRAEADRHDRGKRQRVEEKDEENEPSPLHFRLLVSTKRAGAVIGKGGDFIQQVRKTTGAKLAVDKAIPNYDERVVHIEALDVPDAAVSPAQAAVLQALSRVVGEEEGGKAPDEVTVKLLVFKWQVGAVMGRRGSNINDIRKTSRANIRVSQPSASGPVVPCAMEDDELITLTGSYDQVKEGIKLLTETIRKIPPAVAANYALKKSGPEGSGSDMPASGKGGAPPSLPCRLPVDIASAFEGNDSMSVQGLRGMASVEYRILVHKFKSGAILGSAGSTINAIRDRTLARVMLHDEVLGLHERLLSVMSTEEGDSMRCAAFEAAMECLSHLVFDDQAVQQGSPAKLRLLIAKDQIGAVMGKGGNTIKALRNSTNVSVSMKQDTAALQGLANAGDEVIEIEGPPPNVLKAAHVVLVAIRGNMARGQLVFKHPKPTNAPPPTPVPQPMAPPGPRPPPGPPPPGAGGIPPWGATPPSSGRPTGWDRPANPPNPWNQPAAPPGAPGMPPGMPPQQQMAPSPYSAPPPLPAAPGAPPQQMIHPGQVPGQVPGAVLQMQQAPFGTAQPPLPPAGTYPGQPPVQQQQQMVAPGAPPPAPGAVPGMHMQQQAAYPAYGVAAPTSTAGATGYGAPAASGIMQPPGIQQPQQMVMPQQQQAAAAYAAPPAAVASQPMDANQQAIAAYEAYYAAQAAQAAAAAAAAASSQYNSAMYALQQQQQGVHAGAVATGQQQPPAANGATEATAPTARLLLSQQQVEKLRLNDATQLQQLSMLSGAVIRLSPDMSDPSGARHLELTGTDQQCNTAKALIEALMKSA